MNTPIKNKSKFSDINVKTCEPRDYARNYGMAVARELYLLARKEVR